MNQKYYSTEILPGECHVELRVSFQAIPKPSVDATANLAPSTFPKRVQQQQQHLHHRRSFTVIPSEYYSLPSFEVTPTKPSTSAAETTAATLSSSLQTKKKRKKVNFSTLAIREYNIVLGDSPSVTTGLPISLSWEHTSGRTVPVDVYEEWRNQTKPRRFYYDGKLSLSAKRRNDILVNVGGYTHRELMRIQRKNMLQERSEFFGRPVAM